MILSHDMHDHEHRLEIGLESTISTPALLVSRLCQQRFSVRALAFSVYILFRQSLTKRNIMKRTVRLFFPLGKGPKLQMTEIIAL